MRHDWLIENDLSLTFDNRGRLWKFRPTHSRHGKQPVDARLTTTAIVITVTVPGLESGDVDLHATDNVLQIRGRADRTIDLACDVALPRKVDLDVLETAYAGGILEIRVPLVAPRAESAIESIAVTV
jgi:HSP20 family molecular chaperone IbpA